MTYKVWENIYKKTDYQLLSSRMKNVLNDRKLLYMYYPCVRLIRKNKIKINKSIEIGAGSGQFSLVLKKLNLINEVYLLDIEEKALEIAKKLFFEFGEECKTIKGDILKKKFTKNYFDLSISGGLIEHFNGTKQNQVIESHVNIAKYSILQFPTDNLLYWSVRKIISMRNGGVWPFGYEKPLSKKYANSLFNKNDLEIIDIDFHYFLSALAYRSKNISLRRILTRNPVPFLIMDYAFLVKKQSTDSL